MRLHYSLHRFGDPAIIRLFLLVVPELTRHFFDSTRCQSTFYKPFISRKTSEHVCTPKFDSLWKQFSAQIAVVSGHPYFGQSHLASQIWQVLPGQSFEGHSHWRWTLGKANGGGQAFLLAELGIPWGNRSCAIPFLNYKVEYQSTQD